MKKLKLAALVCAFLLLVACAESGGTDVPGTTATTGGTETTTGTVIETTDETTDTSAATETGESSSGSSASAGTAASSRTASSKAATATTSAATTAAVTTTKKSNVITVCIPEGYSLSQIGDALEAAGVCKKAELLTTANSYDFTYYPLIAAIPQDVRRCYKLEGYLFPDTYEFYFNMKPQDALGKLIRGAEKNIADYTREDMTTDGIVTLASVIEKETGDSSQYAAISSVFHNRLLAGMQLQSDATINYIEWYVKPNLSGDINRYNAYYNTYKCAALPAGPICSPGKRALKAAAEPEDTGYLYFVSDRQGKYYYAVTYEEHLQNCAAAGIGPAE